MAIYTFFRNHRQKLQIFLLFFWGLSLLATTIYQLNTLSGQTIPPLGHDGVSEWENRFTEIKMVLPESGTIGYLADWDMPGNPGSSDLETEYRLTQYTLTPLVVVRGTDYNRVIGNITSQAFDQQLEEFFNVMVLKNSGFGIYLLKGGLK